MNKRQITDLVDQSIQINAHCFVVTADNRYILICGFWDKSFRVYSTETGELNNEIHYSSSEGLLFYPHDMKLKVIKYVFSPGGQKSN